MTDDLFTRAVGLARGSNERSALKLEIQDLLWLDQKQLGRLEHVPERTSEITDAVAGRGANEIVAILQTGGDKFASLPEYPLAQHAVKCISIRSAAPELAYAHAVHKVFQAAFSHVPGLRNLIDEVFSETATKVADDMVDSTAFLARYKTLEGVNLDDPDSGISESVIVRKLVEMFNMCDAKLLSRTLHLNYRGVFEKEDLKPAIDDIFSRDILSMDGDELFDCMVTVFGLIGEWGY